MAELGARFWSKVDKSGDCWQWTGGIKTNGYGDYFVSPTRRHAHPHRLVLEPIPDRLVVDHLCRNRACVNPDHLELVTQGENLRRGHISRGPATHCKRGHEFTEANTIVHRATNQRQCRTCMNAWSNRKYHERKPHARYRA